MRVSEFFKLPKGHNNFEFVDVDTSKDTELFIDPCLIESNHNSFCKNAMITLNDYFDSFYNLYRKNSTTTEKTELFCHAHEINATKLGYGSGDNGKAKTADGMIATFGSIKSLIDSSVPLSKAIDLNIFIPDFAEDCLSDMLTNILFFQLSNFTLEQCKKYQIDTKPVAKSYYYWNAVSHKWEIYRGNGLYINNKFVLLVPKYIVRHKFYYNVDQYFSMVILEKMKEEQTTYDSNGKAHTPTKKSLKEKLLRTHNDVLHISEDKTIRDPSLLEMHHNKLVSAYSGRAMNDDDLDYWVYSYK